MNGYQYIDHEVERAPRESEQLSQHQTVAEQVDAKVFGLVQEQNFDPFFSMIVVLARQRIVSEQKAAPHDAADDVHNAEFVR